MGFWDKIFSRKVFLKENSMEQILLRVFHRKFCKSLGKFYKRFSLFFPFLFKKGILKKTYTGFKKGVFFFVGKMFSIGFFLKKKAFKDTSYGFKKNVYFFVGKKFSIGFSEIIS